MKYGQIREREKEKTKKNSPRKSKPGENFVYCARSSEIKKSKT